MEPKYPPFLTLAFRRLAAGALRSALLKDALTILTIDVLVSRCLTVSRYSTVTKGTTILS